MANHRQAAVLAQLKANSVAIISLLTALGGFTYNSWRDHRNELNQNMREASFEVLKSLGELQTVVHYAHYDHDWMRGNPVDGWGQVLLIRDLSRLLPHAAAEHGRQLYVVWQRDWDGLGNDVASEARISDEIARARQSVLETIDRLE